MIELFRIGLEIIGGACIFALIWLSVLAYGEWRADRADEREYWRDR